MLAISHVTVNYTCHEIIELKFCSVSLITQLVRVCNKWKEIDTLHVLQLGPHSITQNFHFLHNLVLPSASFNLIWRITDPGRRNNVVQRMLQLMRKRNRLKSPARPANCQDPVDRAVQGYAPICFTAMQNFYNWEYWIRCM